MNQLTRDPAFIAAATASANAAAAATAASIKQQQMHRSSTCNSELNATPEIGDWNSTDEINFMEAADPQKFNERMYPQYGWIDITKDFMDACSELSLGELAQDVVFGLFEAMSAIEMMDPKMDIGMVYNKNDAPPHTFETAVEAGILKLENLENSELIGIFDSVFACVVSWLEGNFMDLVLFTCLYLHSPKSIVDKSLRSFCYAVRNLISIVKNIIVCSDVSEEEDFQLYGNTGFTSIDDFRHILVAPALKEAEDDMVRRSKTESNSEDTMAVVHRLRFMRFFFQSIHQLDPGNGTPPDEAKISEIHKNLNAALELIPLIRRTIDKGTQPDPESEAPNPMGFSPRVHVRNLPPTFPRRAMIRDRPSSLQFLEELVQRLKFALKIIRQRDYYSALNFFIEFSRKSGQCILSRSVLQTLFLTDRGALVFGAIPFKDFLWDSVRAFNAPPVLNPRSLLANDRKIQMYLDSFFRYCISMNTFKHFIQICGFNRARQRDKLARFIEGFGNIQVEAARLDSHLSMLTAEKSAAEAGNSSGTTVATANCGTVKHTAQFATWVLYNCFRAMMLYLMSGFELELYSVHEFLYIYWYPYELLISFIVSALTRTETNLLEQESLAEQQSKNAPGNNSKQRKAKPKKKKQLKPYRQEIVYYHAMLSMCGGFYKAMGAFTKDERIRQPMPKFDNEEIRFNRRFAPFAALTSPPQVSYTEFKKIRAHMMRPPSSEIYMYAAKHFDQARSILESIQNPEQDILDMIQVAKVNFVVMNVLAKGHQKDSKTQPDFDFSKHRHFPIIKLN